MKRRLSFIIALVMSASTVMTVYAAEDDIAVADPTSAQIQYDEIDPVGVTYTEDVTSEPEQSVSYLTEDGVLSDTGDVIYVDESYTGDTAADYVTDYSGGDAELLTDDNVLYDDQYVYSAQEYTEDMPTDTDTAESYTAPYIYIEHSDFSPSYKNSIWYRRLMSVSLTGDYLTDMFAIAKSQLGYHEGSNYDEQDGYHLGDRNFAEYTYWFGEPGQKWCGEYVGWCIAMASIPHEIFKPRFYTGDDRTFKWSDTEYSGGDTGYEIKPGDVIVFQYRGGDHVVLVESVECEDGIVTLHTYNGNYSNSVCRTDYVIDSGTGRTLNVWTTARGYVSYIYSPDFSIAESLDYYTVTFDANGGYADYYTKRLTASATYGLMPVPVREGYVFDGWYTDPQLGSKVTNYSLFTEGSDQTLYAHWIEEGYADDEFSWLGMESIELKTGESVRLTPGLWTTSDANIAPVSANRLFAKHPGTTSISGATDNGIVYKIIVNVKPGSDDDIEESPVTAQVDGADYPADTDEYIEQSEYDFGGELLQSAFSPNRYILKISAGEKYSLEETGMAQSDIRRISRENVAYVDGDGYVCAVSAGRCVIRGRVNGKIVRITVKVTETGNE